MIKDFDRDIYGKELCVKTVKKIRDIEKFKNQEDLKAQIGRDIRENL